RSAPPREPLCPLQRDRAHANVLGDRQGQSAAPAWGAFMDLLDQLRQGVRTQSAAETQQWGRTLAAALPPDATLALHGDLGVGKTTFVQGLAQGLGVRENVTSPTFNLFTVYRGTERTLLHLDAYRLENERQVDALMLEDFLVSPY